MVSRLFPGRGRREVGGIAEAIIDRLAAIRVVLELLNERSAAVWLLVENDGVLFRPLKESW